jgi:hypothetical protein
LVVGNAHPLIGGQREVFAIFAQVFKGVELFIPGVWRFQAA